MKSLISSTSIVLFLMAFASFTAINATHSPTHTLAKRAVLDADVAVGLCVTLTADADIVGTVGGSTVVTQNQLNAGTCLCISALVDLGVGPGGISLGLGAEVTASTGLVFTGTTAIDLANAIAAEVINGNIGLLAGLGISATSGCAACPAEEIGCNGNCYPASQYICQSGIPVKTAGPTKRDLLCSASQESCPAWSGLTRGKRSLTWECIDTQNDVESCGGCLQPISLSSSVGQDCTAIPNVDRTACVSGKCVVVSCRKGWRLVGSGFSVSCQPLGTAYSVAGTRRNKDMLRSMA